ncbi:MAG: ribosome biogenesis GTPase YlqF [Clostridia bacterium]
MNIQWFPGHMTKAVRLIEENLKLVDVVGYVLDSRAPSACFNPIFDKIVGDKSVVYILNKSDLADMAKLQAFAYNLKKEGKVVVTINAANGNSVKGVAEAFKEASKVRIEKFKSKGIYRPTRAMIIGVPNCGKSTIINALCGRKATITGDKPGVTKGKQWVRLTDGLELLDTPGTLWGRFDDEKDARHLLYIGSIKDDIADIEEIAPYLMDELKLLYPNELKVRYKFETLDKSGLQLLTDLCIMRSFTLKGGEIDIERGARSLLDEFRKGKIGKISF